MVTATANGFTAFATEGAENAENGDGKRRVLGYGYGNDLD